MLPGTGVSAQIQAALLRYAPRLDPWDPCPNLLGMFKGENVSVACVLITPDGCAGTVALEAAAAAANALAMELLPETLLTARAAPAGSDTL